MQGQTSLGQAQTQRVRTVYPIFVNSSTDSSRKGRERLSLVDRVSFAQARWFLSAAENQISYSAVERQLKLLPQLDSNSDVLKKMVVSRSTVSAVCSEALGPHYKVFMCRKMQKAQVFTLGLDSSTVELGGLDKHLDIKIRFFD